MPPTPIPTDVLYHVMRHAAPRERALLSTQSRALRQHRRHLRGAHGIATSPEEIFRDVVKAGSGGSAPKQFDVARAKGALEAAVGGQETAIGRQVFLAWLRVWPAGDGAVQYGLHDVFERYIEQLFWEIIDDARTHRTNFQDAYYDVPEPFAGLDDDDRRSMLERAYSSIAMNIHFHRKRYGFPADARNVDAFDIENAVLAQGRAYYRTFMATRDPRSIQALIARAYPSKHPLGRNIFDALVLGAEGLF